MNNLFKKILANREIHKQNQLIQAEKKAAEDKEKNMSYDDLHILWNKNGECARGACRAKFKTERWRGGRHRVTNYVYCRSCSRLLNLHQPELNNPVTELAEGEEV